MGWHRVFAGLACVAVAVTVLAYGYLFGGWFTVKRSLAEHRAFLSAAFDLRLPPAADGPAPAAILMPGCLGTQGHHRDWAAFLRRQGWATLTVDSFTPRGLHGTEALTRVCEGEDVWGFERSADILAAIVHLSTRPRVDPGRIVLFGWSHGAWAAMDALTFGPASRPTNLKALPDNAVANITDDIAGAVLFYPYCGWGTRSRTRGWHRRVPALLFLAGRDENVPTGACIATAAALKDSGIPIEETVFPEATHWFDHQGGDALMPHTYSPIATAMARSQTQAFLARLAGRTDTRKGD